MNVNQSIKWLKNVNENRITRIITLVILEVVLSMITIGYAYLFRDIIDKATANDNNSFINTVVILVVILVIQIVLQALDRRLSDDAFADIDNNLRHYFYQRLISRKYSVIIGNHSGEWMSRITGDCRIIANDIVSIVPGFVAMTVKILGIIASVIMIDAKSATLVIPGTAAVMFLTVTMRKKSKKMQKEIQEANAEVNAYLQENIENSLVIKAYDVEKDTVDCADDLMSQLNVKRTARSRFLSFSSAGFSLIMNGAYVFIGAYCGLQLLRQKMSYGTVVALLQLVAQFQGPFSSISNYIQRFYGMIACCERIRMVDELEAEDEYSISKNEIKEFYDSNFVSFGFRNVSFHYTDNNEDYLIRDCNLEIYKGDFVAVTGQSGCGKSTLLKLLMSFYSVSEGEIYYKTGNDEGQLGKDYRRLFAYVPQQNLLLSGKIIDTVAFYDEPVDLKRLQDALYLSCSDEFVDELADGVNTVLNERGSGLSEGQMQRLAIARAIYSQRPILLLDEATSALDEETWKKMLGRITREKNRTIIMVTHSNDALGFFNRQIICENREGEVTWTMKNI